MTTTRVAPLDFPALDGRPVTQAHADICASRGHATHRVAGIDQQVCPRCGESTTEPFGPLNDPAACDGGHSPAERCFACMDAWTGEVGPRVGALSGDPAPLTLAPIELACAGCNAEAGEPCRPWCLPKVACGDCNTDAGEVCRPGCKMCPGAPVLPVLVLTLTDAEGTLLDRVEVPREEYDAEVAAYPHGALAQLQVGG